MDVLGAIAIGTEPIEKDQKYLEKDSKSKFSKVEKRRNKKILVMDYNWRQIIV
jgi:hypothetical protein